MQISIVNLDPTLSTADIVPVVRAINVQIERDFAPYWHMSARLRLDSGDPERSTEELSGMRGDAIIYIADEPSESYLGYHDQTASGVPFGFVFRSVSRELGEHWSVTLSHEALELLADPACNLLCKGPHPDPDEGERPVFHWFEMCDAVQTETYRIDDVEVSNFVLPAYFTGGEELEGRNDFLATQTPEGRLQSFGVNPGGYVGFFDPKTESDETWTPSEKAMQRAELKERRISTQFRRADRRRQAHPLAVASKASLLPSHIEAVEALWIEAKDTNLRALHASILPHVPEPFVLRALPETDEYLLTGDLLRLPLGELWSLAERLQGLPDIADCDVMLVARAEDPAPLRRASGRRTKTCACDPTSIPQLPHRWSHDSVRVRQAWDLLAATHPGQEPGTGVVIAHPDTGYTAYLRQRGRILPGGDDFTVRDSDGVDPLVPGFPGHGTRTGSVIVAPRDDGDAVDGVAPGARLLPFRIGGTVFVLSGLNLSQAIHAAIRAHADIVSMSVGGAPSRRLARALAAAHDADMILIAAAGNCVGFVVAPAAFDECIACAAIDHQDRPWCGSSRGPQVDISAPGAYVWTITPVEGPGDTQFVAKQANGTSFATATVAGCAALWLHRHGGRAAVRQQLAGKMKVHDAFRIALQASVRTPTGWDATLHGPGIVDAEALLRQPLPQQPSAPRSTPEAVDAIARTFPDLPSSEVRGRLANALGLDESTLPDALARHGTAIATLAAWDESFRAFIENKAPTRKAQAADPTRQRTYWRSLLPGDFPSG